MVKVALLIGASEYEPGLNPLPSAVKDVAALQRILQDSEIGSFDEVKVLTNPDPQTMQYEIETLFTGRNKDDLVLLFFSGHGIKDDSNNLYFATRITRKNPKGDLIRSTAVPARFVHEVMNNSRAKRQAIILDCCFSGAFDPALQAKDDGSVDLQGQLGAEGRVVLTSSSSTQYSFEQQGSELSLYTRYLVEGIETGAGDRDEDGKISILELHEYATSKVQETAPNMTPKLITLKDMGFEIVLANAKVTDPQLRYRKQVERYSSRGSISPIGRTILDKLQTQLGLSPEVTREIEAKVLRPYQERLENLQRYRQILAEAIKHEYPLNRNVQSELEDLREVLGLRQEDVDSIEQEILAQKSQAESEVYQQKLQRYEQEFRRAIEVVFPLNSHQRQELKDLQRFLMLEDEDIAQTEETILKQVDATHQKVVKRDKNDSKRHEQSEESKTSKAESIKTRTSNSLQGKQKLLGGVGIIGVIIGLVLTVQNEIQNSSRTSQEAKLNDSITVAPAQDPKAKSSVGHGSLVSSLAFSPNGKILASGSWDSSVKVWNLSNSELIYNLPASSWSVLAVAISPDSKTLANGNGYGPTIESETVRLWDLGTGKLIRSISASAKIRAVTFSLDGKTLISGAEDKTIKIWNANDGQLLKTLSGHSEIVTSLAVTSNGKNFVSGSFDKTIKLWDLQTGELIRTFSGHSGAVTSVAINPGNKLVVSGSSDKTIKLWDLQTGELIRTFSGHSGAVTSVAISPDGQSLVSGDGGYDSSDRTVRVWNLKTGEVIHTLNGHSEEITAVAVSPDGKIIASGSRDARVKIWSLDTGKLLRTF